MLMEVESVGLNKQSREVMTYKSLSMNWSLSLMVEIHLNQEVNGVM